MSGQRGCRRRIDAGEFDQPPDQPWQGSPARADREVGIFQHDLAHRGLESRRNVQIGKSILAGEVGEPWHRSGAEVFDVRRQAPPGIGVERCAADLCEIAELTEKGGEV